MNCRAGEVAAVHKDYERWGKAWYEKNRKHVLEQHRVKGKTIKEKRRRRNYNLKKLYGITLGEYEEKLLEQNYKCVICASKEHLHVDHCHSTGVVRGLLCNNCNRSIGMLKEDSLVLRKAADYLDKFKT